MKKRITILALLASFCMNAQEVNTDSVDAKVKENVLEAKQYINNKIEAVKRAVAKGILTKEEGAIIIKKVEESKIEMLNNTLDYAISLETLENAVADYEIEDAEAVEVDFDSVVEAEDISDIDMYSWNDVPEFSEEDAEFKTEFGLMLGFGFSNLAKNNQFSNSEFGYARSTNFEVGLLARTPFSKKDYTYGIKYGLTLNSYFTTPTGNKHFVKQGEDVVLENYDYNLRRGQSYLNNMYITVPVMFDFDFSKPYYNATSNKYSLASGFKFALGGYVGFNIHSSQTLSYRNENGHKITENQKGNWNTNNFQYGLQASVGYGPLSLYGKYDLNNMFKSAPTEMNLWSLGLRIEI